MEPALPIGVLVPGARTTKATVIEALAAAQTAFVIAQAEVTLARATDAIAIKFRSDAISDTNERQNIKPSPSSSFSMWHFIRNLDT